MFDAQKNAVKSLKLLGAAAMASGRYIDMEKEQRNKKSQADSLKVESGDNAPKEKMKSHLDMIKKMREKQITPPKDL